MESKYSCVDCKHLNGINFCKWLHSMNDKEFFECGRWWSSNFISTKGAEKYCSGFEINVGNNDVELQEITSLSDRMIELILVENENLKAEVDILKQKLRKLGV